MLRWWWWWCWEDIYSLHVARSTSIHRHSAVGFIHDTAPFSVLAIAECLVLPHSSALCVWVPHWAYILLRTAALCACVHNTHTHIYTYIHWVVGRIEQVIRLFLFFSFFFLLSLCTFSIVWISLDSRIQARTSHIHNGKDLMDVYTDISDRVTSTISKNTHKWHHLYWAIEIISQSLYCIKASL